MILKSCDSKTDAQGRELMEHGTLWFPIACYHDDLQKTEVPWHWHEELEAGIITEGQALMAIGTEKRVLKPGDGFFINTGVLHGIWKTETESCQLHSVVFHPRLVGGSMDSVFWKSYLNPLLEERSLKGIFLEHETDWHQKAMEAVEDTWQSCKKEGPGYEFQVRNALSQLIFLLNRGKRTLDTRPSEKELRKGERMKRMLQYVQEHYGDSEKIDTAQIADSAGISVSECLRCFRSMIGATPISYVKWFRVQRAAELLKSTDWKIAEIGIRCGFQEMSYFAKSFREIKGCTPSEYRKSEQ